MTDATDILNDPESERLVAALRAMPAPEPRPGFVDRALRIATGIATANVEAGQGWGWRRTRRMFLQAETWIGAAAGAAVALVATFLLLNPPQSEPQEAGITLSLNEMREIDVLIDSDRELPGATIRVAVTGGVALDGFDNEHIVDWQAD